jgi:ABC-type transport system involved in multi-copper enzyme maturation permease subunit
MIARPLSLLNTAILSAGSSIKLGLRDRTLALLTAMFFVLVLISAYLGWSATATVNAIYEKSVPLFQSQGLAVPPNPVGDTPPLTLFRNMVTYVALLGALAALVLGHQSVASDRKAGVLPLLASRPLSRTGFALGKIFSLAVSLALVLAAAGLINVLTMLLLPGIALDNAVWAGLAKFYSVSALYMLAFSLLGAIFASGMKTESMALLVPVTIWLALTFIVPQITSNISPMAAMNPQSANIIAPTSQFFTATAALLGPLSIAEAYRHLTSIILGITSGAGASTTTGGAIASLIIANLVLAAVFAFMFTRLDACRSEYRD